MAKRKPKLKPKTKPGFALKVGGVTLLSCAAGFLVFVGVTTLMYQSNYFKVKSIVFDPSLHFVDKGLLSRYKDVSIFKIDLKDIHKRISFRYPQVSDIKILRKFPNQIHVSAVQRLPFAQTVANGKVLTLDVNGVILSTTSNREDRIPLIVGMDQERAKITLGRPIQESHMAAALDILSNFREERDLNSFQVAQIDATNLSKIELTLSNKLNVILDKYRTRDKMDILGLVLTQAELNLNDVKYIDLRFKEPIIGKK